MKGEMSQTIDWVEVEKVVSLATSLKRLPDDTKAALKRHLKQPDGKHTGTFLTALTVRYSLKDLKEMSEPRVCLQFMC